MNRLVRFLSVIAMFVFAMQYTNGYSPTLQDKQLSTALKNRLTVILEQSPQKKSVLYNLFVSMKIKYSTNQRFVWLVTQLIQMSDITDQGATDNDSNTDDVTSCTIFPSDNPWNTDISNYLVNSNSDNYIKTIVARKKYLHPDFGANRDGGPFGIPYIIVGKDQSLVQVKATRYPDESDQWNFPVPLTAPIEKWWDAHVIAVDTYNCKLYELYAASKVWNTWEAWSVAVFDMKSNKLRPEWWTSADAAWLPIFPWLVRYDEVEKWEINHAIRFTLSKTQKAYIHPATHYASSNTSSNEAPMWLRFRLKKDFDTSKFYWQSKVIVEAMKKYGMIVADNGSDRFISWAPDSRRDDEDLNQIKNIPWSAFEVVDTWPIIK